jgi:hypothetical protein
MPDCGSEEIAAPYRTRSISTWDAALARSGQSVEPSPSRNPLDALPERLKNERRLRSRA